MGCPWSQFPLEELTWGVPGPNSPRLSLVSIPLVSIPPLVPIPGLDDELGVEPLAIRVFF